MDVTQLPFNKLIGLEAAPAGSGYLVGLPGDPRHANHLGSVHASALLAVAEAGSGVFLAQRFASHAGFVPVVRRLEAKFRKPATGGIFARCLATSEDVSRWDGALATRGRVLASLPVDVVDMDGSVVMSATVEWFIARPAA